MQIPNPWPRVSSRCTCSTPAGKVVTMSCSAGHLEVPDDSLEVVIEPVKVIGRGGAVRVLGQSRIWSKDWGLLDIEDHVKKLDLSNELAEAKANKDKALKRATDKAKAEMKAKKAKAKAKNDMLPEKSLEAEASSRLEMTDGMSDEVKCGGPISLDDPRNMDDARPVLLDDPKDDKDDQGMYKN